MVTVIISENIRVCAECAQLHLGGVQGEGGHVLYCTVLYCTVLYCTVLYCTVLCPPWRCRGGRWPCPRCRPPCPRWPAVLTTRAVLVGSPEEIGYYCRSLRPFMSEEVLIKPKCFYPVKHLKETKEISSNLQLRLCICIIIV